MKKILSVFAVFSLAVAIFAGDVAAFVDLGISADGKFYAFGEYGMTDGDFCAYAEIFVVDIEKNVFVNGEVFKNVSQNKSGRASFDELCEKNRFVLSKYDFKTVEVSELLYQRELDKNLSAKISFQDFEGSSVEEPFFYSATIVPNFEGTGKNISSSFFISLEKSDKDGKILSRQIVGTPIVKRKGVSDYKINRIFTDKSGKGLIFVVEKTLQDSTGTSIRYMVETTCAQSAIGKQ